MYLLPLLNLEQRCFLPLRPSKIALVILLGGRPAFRHGSRTVAWLFVGCPITCFLLKVMILCGFLALLFIGHRRSVFANRVFVCFFRCR